MADSALKLFYEFAKRKTLVARQGLGPTLGITRASNATYFDSSGVLQTALANIARFDHDPATKESLGLLIEEARTNLCLQSEDFTNASWVKNSITVTGNQAVAPDGNTTADKLDDPAGNFGNVTQSFTVTNDATYYTFSVYIEKDTDTTRFPEVQFQFSGGTPFTSSVQLNTQTGATNIRQNSNDASVLVQDADTYWRFMVTEANNNTGNTSLDILLFPAVGDVFGQIDASVTGVIFAWGSQLENQDFPTSYIKTTTSSVTRNADDVRTTTLDWLDIAATVVGTFYVRGSWPNTTHTQTNAYAMFLGSGDPIDTVNLTRAPSGGNDYLFVAVNNSVDTDALIQLDGAGTVLPNTDYKVSLAYADDDAAAYINGNAGTPDSTVALPFVVNPDTLSVGSHESANSFNGHIAELRYYNIRKNNQFLEDLSNGLISETFWTGILSGFFSISNCLKDPDFLDEMRKEAEDITPIWCKWDAGFDLPTDPVPKRTGNLNLNLSLIQNEAEGLNPTWGRWAPGVQRGNTGNLQLNMRLAIAANFVLTV